MKRRLLSAFLAVMMVLTMAPVAFAADGVEPTDGTGSSEVTSAVAKIGDTDYATLQAAVNAANNGDTVQLLTDVLQNSEVCINKDITLDLNGKKIYNTKDIWADSVVALVNVTNNANVTITGNGEITAKENDCYAINLVSGTLTIENGNIVGNVSAVQVQAGHLYIKGGTFSLLQKWENKSTYLINMIDKAYQDGSARATITGGTFVDYEPSQSTSEHPNANFVPTGYNVTQDGNSYVVTVKSDNAAEISDIQYATLADAVAAAQSGETVKLLANIAEGATIPADKTVTLDLNGKNIKPTTGDAIVNKGNLTIVGSGEVAAQNSESAAIANFPGATANVNGGTFVSAHWYVIKNLGNMTIDGPVTIKKPEGNTDTSSLIDNGWYGSTDKVAGESVSAQADKAKLTIKSGEFTGKSGAASCSVIKNDDYATLDISGGAFDSTNNQNTSNATTILNWNVATISGGTFIGQYPLANGAYNNAADKGQFTISGGTFTGLQSLFGYGQGGDGVGKITITDGNFAAPAFGDWGSAYTMEISGGYFTTDPSKYLATSTDAQKKYIAKAVTGDYKFHVELADANDLQVVPVAGATAAPSKDELKNNKDIPSDQVDNIVTAAKAVSAPEISKAAQEVAANISDNSNTLDKQYQDAAKNEVPNQKKIEVRAYLEVKPTAYNADEAYTLDITPKYDVVVVGTKDGATAEKVVETNTLNVTKATEVSVQLPAGFVSDTNTKLYVQHKGHEYDAAVTANNGVYTANFTNPHGFSPFTISKTSQSVAKVGNNKYTTFQDAVNAVENNGTIEIVGGNKDYTATISGSSKTIKVKNSLTDKNIKVTVNGESKTIEPSKDATFTYTKPSSGGSSGGSSSGKTTYKVTTSAVNNGGVNASPSSAEKGAAITITLSPDKGYKLDKLTVTDGSGKTVSTVKKSDTVYTFTMPASAVKVGVSYVKATETPSETKFNDVSANDWFASAVDYVTGKGMMNGTADNTFSPKANTTRGMVVTVLYRLENQPSTSAASFTDVASGAYYANAVAWANANGIVSGYGSGKFGPNDKVTREQLAAILYRYAQYKKYDVSVGEDTNILSYDDAQSISSYAIPAIQWACGAGVVTGKSGSKLDPKGNATRAEVAAMLMRFCENVK